MSSRVQLSCKSCHQRKVKCDKASPCGACRRNGTQCVPVQRQRLPRGRSGNLRRAKAEVLHDRIAQLEAIISQSRNDTLTIPQTVSSASNTLSPSGSGTGQAQSLSSASLASDFWQNLCQAVTGLREAFEENEVQDENSGDHISLHTEQSGFDSNDTSIFSSLWEMSPEDPVHEIRKDVQLRHQLFMIYHERFDPLFKVFHWPAIKGFFLEGHCEWNYMPLEGKAIETSILFAAICTTRPEELPNRLDLVTKFKKAAEACFASARLLVNNDLLLLQAFVIYLAALRACQVNAEQWTLLPVAIRIASSLGMPRNILKGRSQIEDQTRLRLWHSIGVLDLQCAFDRGSQPLLTRRDFSTLPIDANDQQFSPFQYDNSLDQPRTSPERYTDMTFAMVTYHANLCQREIVQAAYNNASSSAAFSEQQHSLSRFEAYVEGLAAICDDAAPPLLVYALAVARESMLSMRLLIHRPLHPVTTNIDTLDIGFDVFQAAIKLLESAAFKSKPEFQKWAWFSWVKWFALAVALAEICGRSWDERSEQAWSVIDQSFTDYKNLVADSEYGLLWRPIDKLMRRASRVRRDASAQHQVAVGEQSVLTDIDVTLTSDDSVGQTIYLGPSWSRKSPSPGSEDPWMQWNTFLEDFDSSTWKFDPYLRRPLG